MKRLGPAAWMLLILAGVAAAVLALGPFGWLAAGRASDVRPASTADGEGRTPAPRPAAALEPGAGPPAPAAKAPEEESRRALEPVVRAGLVSLRVLDPTGRPQGGLRALLARDGRILLDGFTGEDGELEHPADSREAILVVTVPSRPPESFTVRLDPGRQELRLRLAAGEGVAGQLLREDGKGAGDLKLLLRSDHPFAVVPDVPEVVWEALAISATGRTVLGTTSGDDGRFAFAGLRSGWSGVLMLPSGWRVVHATEGEVEAGATRIRLERPASALILHIAPDWILHGRLVLGDGLQPLAGARLSAMILLPGDPSPKFTSATADVDGRFELRSRSEEIDSLELRLGGRFHQGSTILRVEGRAIPPDGDLGEVVVEAVRDVPFIVQDPAREPIAGAVAAALGTRSAPTGTHGRSKLRWIPRSVDRMRVVAEGFVPAEVALPEELPEPLEVILQPANRLEVRLLLPPGGDPTQFKVVLRREEGVAAAPVADRAEQEDHTGKWAFPSVDLMRAPERSYLAASPGAEDGVAAFRALQPGVAIDLEIRPITGEASFHSRTLDALGPSEVRRVEVDLREGLRVFRGRVLDLKGDPLVRASLQLQNQILGWTDESGNFLCFVLPDQKPGTLVIQHQACSTAFLHDYAVPSGGQPQEFRLKPARRVTIEVVDEAGAPVPQAEVWILQEGFTTNTHRLEGHRHVASSLTDNPFQIEVRLAGRVYTQDHSSSSAQARVVVPVHGRVVAVVDPSTLAGRAGGFTVVLSPAEGEPEGSVAASRSAAPDVSIVLPMIHPGNYRATLRYDPTADEQAAGRKPESSAGIPLSVEAGRETEVRLSLEAGG